MPDPSLPLQAAVVARLKSFPELTALIAGRVYDAPPSKAATPYVNVGEDQILGDHADCYSGSEFYLTIHAWATEPGYVEVKRVSSAVRDALHEAALSVPGFRLVDIKHESTRHLRDQDGITSHGVLVFRGFAEPID